MIILFEIVLNGDEGKVECVMLVKGDEPLCKSCPNTNENLDFLNTKTKSAKKLNFKLQIAQKCFNFMYLAFLSYYFNIRV